MTLLQSNLKVRLILSLSLIASAAGEPAGTPDNDRVQVSAPTSTSAPALPLEGFAEIGSSFAQSSKLPQLGWDEAQIDAFIDGVKSALHGKAYPYADAANKVSAEMGRRVHEIEQRAKSQSSPSFAQSGQLQQYSKEIRKRLRLQQTDSGLCYSVGQGYGGLRPRPSDTIVFSYTTMAADGATSIPQLAAERIRIKMTDLLPGFLEGLQMMTVDSKGVFMMPPALSFGETDWPAGVPRGPLIFQITLHEVISAEPAP